MPLAVLRVCVVGGGGGKILPGVSEGILVWCDQPSEAQFTIYSWGGVAEVNILEI